MKATYLSIILSLLCIPVFSQVRIGSLSEPEKGAILDLSNIAPDYVGGLKLPNVDIPNLEEIPAGFTGLGIAQPTNATLAGLIVFNTNATTGVGVYVWDGDKWKKITK